MSATQLRDVFHVDDVNSVPHYELVTLTHHSTAQHVRKKRSIESGSAAIARADSLNSVISSDKLSHSNLVGNHHVKKDLSKSPYSEKLNSVFGDKSDLNSGKRKSQAANDEAPTSAKPSEKSAYSDVKLSDISEHKVSFDAFGAKLNLTLKPTEGLFRKGPQSLKMWHALPDPNATDGIDYKEIKSVSG